MSMTTPFHPNSSLNPQYESIIDDLLENIDENLEVDPDFQAWLAEDEIIGNAGNDDRVGLPATEVWIAAIDRAYADRLAQSYPDPEYGAIIRRKTLAAAALTGYLESHGIEVDRSAAQHRQPVLQLLNPEADVVLPNLGRLEAVTVDSVNFTADNQVEIDLSPGTLGYILVSLESDRCAVVHGVLLSSDLRQDWPAGGSIPVTLAKPIAALWEAYSKWQKCQWVTQNSQELENWSPEFRANLIIALTWAMDYEKDFNRPGAIDRFCMEQTNNRLELPVLNANAVREDCPQSGKEDGPEVVSGREQQDNSINWFNLAVDWLDELDTDWD